MQWNDKADPGVVISAALRGAPSELGRQKCFVNFHKITQSSSLPLFEMCLLKMAFPHCNIKSNRRHTKSCCLVLLMPRLRAPRHIAEYLNFLQKNPKRASRGIFKCTFSDIKICLLIKEGCLCSLTHALVQIFTPRSLARVTRRWERISTVFVLKLIVYSLYAVVAMYVQIVWA